MLRRGKLQGREQRQADRSRQRARHFITTQDLKALELTPVILAEAFISPHDLPALLEFRQAVADLEATGAIASQEIINAGSLIHYRIDFKSDADEVAVFQFRSALTDVEATGAIALHEIIPRDYINVTIDLDALERLGESNTHVDLGSGARDPADTMDIAAAIAAAARTLLDHGVKDLPNRDLNGLLRVVAAEIETRQKAQGAIDEPRLDWIEARKQSGKVADLLAAFIKDKFADELANREMSTNKLYRYKRLYQDFHNHRHQLPLELQNLPKKGEFKDRLVAEGKVVPVRPRLPRTENVRAYDRAAKRVSRAPRQKREATPT